MVSVSTGISLRALPDGTLQRRPYGGHFEREVPPIGGALRKALFDSAPAGDARRALEGDHVGHQHHITGVPDAIYNQRATRRSAASRFRRP
jgi:hypothetical protein